LLAVADGGLGLPADLVEAECEAILGGHSSHLPRTSSPMVCFVDGPSILLDAPNSASAATIASPVDNPSPRYRFAARYHSGYSDTSLPPSSDTSPRSGGSRYRAPARIRSARILRISPSSRPGVASAFSRAVTSR